MTLRQAIANDLDAIMLLERRSFPTDAWSEAMMREELAGSHSHYLVDEEGGRVVGYGGLRALKGSSDADIQTIALDADFRGTGRGRALLRALIAEAVARGAKELFLEVRADNPVAEGLYLSEGFVELGRRPRYYQPDDVDAVVMRLDLRAWAARPSHDLQEIARSAGPDAGIRPAEQAKSGGPDEAGPDEAGPDAAAPEAQEESA